jgi:hypothetical protein
MLEGIKLLIERMETNPEEFTGDLSYRWSNIMQDLAKHGPEFLDPEDMMALNLKVKEVRRKELNAKIMDEIATQKRLKRAQEEHDERTTLERSVLAKGTVKASGLLPSNTMKAWWADEASKTARIDEVMEQNKIQQQDTGNKLWR